MPDVQLSWKTIHDLMNYLVSEIRESSKRNALIFGDVVTVNVMDVEIIIMNPDIDQLDEKKRKRKPRTKTKKQSWKNQERNCDSRSYSV